MSSSVVPQKKDDEERMGKLQKEDMCEKCDSRVERIGTVVTDRSVKTKELYYNVLFQCSYCKRVWFDING